MHVRTAYEGVGNEGMTQLRVVVLNQIRKLMYKIKVQQGRRKAQVMHVGTAYENVGNEGMTVLW